MKCKKIILTPLTILFLMGSMFMPDLAFCFDCKIMPDEISPGSMAIIHLKKKKDETIKSILFENAPLPVLFKKNGEIFTMLGVDLDARSGTYKVLLKFKRKNKIFSRTLAFKIKEKTFPEEHITVKKEMVHLSAKDLKRVRSDQKEMAEALKEISPDVKWSSPFIWPINSKVISPFGLRRFFNGEPRSPHSGIDLRAGEGKEIKASNSGVVTLIRDCFFSGNTLVINHGGGLFTIYAHLSSFKVNAGDMVKKGEVIGLAGATGRATGPHLHWGVSILGKRVDPLSLLELLGELHQGE